VELRQLKYFVAVAEELHFRRAAERLYVAQPAVSEQVRKLEGELGVRLFDRTNRRVSLTVAGAALLDNAKRVLAEADSDGALRRVTTSYLDYMTRVVAYYEQQSVALFGREIPQVLLLHANALNAEMFDALAEMLKRRGYRFVSLDRVLADPAYRSEDRYTGPAGITWLHRWALTQGKRSPFFGGEPTVPEESAKRAGRG